MAASPRAVPAARAFAWYAEAMRLWKRAPWTFCTLALLTIACELALGLVPEVGTLTAKIVAPLVACGLLYASVAAGAGEQPRVAFAVAAFRADAGALAAVIVADAMIFLAEWLAADALAGVNLLQPGAGTLGSAAVLGVYAIGMLASLPLTFVPFAALFEHAGFAGSFSRSLRGFALNTPALLVYAALSFGLLVFGLLTMTIGLLIALPLWATSSYAAWRDIFPDTGQAVGRD